MASRQSGLDIKLILAGPLTDDEAKESVRLAQSSLADSIQLRGPVSAETKDRFYNDIDAFIFPSRYLYEAQPLVVIEALSYGIPVIVTDQGYTAELVGSAGIIVADQAQFAAAAMDAISNWILDPSSYFDARIAARERYSYLSEKARVEMLELERILCSS